MFYILGETYNSDLSSRLLMLIFNDRVLYLKYIMCATLSRKPVEHFLKAVDEVTLDSVASIAQKLLSSPLTMASYGDGIYHAQRDPHDIYLFILIPTEKKKKSSLISFLYLIISLFIVVLQLFMFQAMILSAASLSQSDRSFPMNESNQSPDGRQKLLSSSLVHCLLKKRQSIKIQFISIIGKIEQALFVNTGSLFDGMFCSIYLIVKYSSANSSILKNVHVLKAISECLYFGTLQFARPLSNNLSFFFFLLIFNNKVLLETHACDFKHFQITTVLLKIYCKSKLGTLLCQFEWSILDMLLDTTNFREIATLWQKILVQFSASFIRYSELFFLFLFFSFSSFSVTQISTKGLVGYIHTRYYSPKRYCTNHLKKNCIFLLKRCSKY